jgi:hypothetical protein
MKHAKLIIETLDEMAQVALRPEDLGRWAEVKEKLLQRAEETSMNDMAKEAEAMLRSYDGSDFKAVGDDIEPLHGRGTNAYFKLGEMTPAIPVFIHARHQYSGGWKYDLNIAVKMGDGYHVTRLYNVEEKWILTGL